MPTQHEIAEHLGLNQSEVSRHMNRLGVDWKRTSMDEIRLIYIRHLRDMASGHADDDGANLVAERIKTEIVDREIKLLDLAERREILIDVKKLEPELMQMVLAFRAELLSIAPKIRDDIFSIYGIEIDESEINGFIHHALANFGRYNPGHSGANS